MSEINKEVVREGERARQIYEDKVFKSAMRALKERIFSEFCKCDVNDDQARRDMHQLMLCADIFEEELKVKINAATIELRKNDIRLRKIER